MKTLSILVMLSLVMIITMADQDVPLSKNPYGFSVGDLQGTRQINFFLDFMCPDSKASFFQWQKVRHLSDFDQQKVKLTYQFNPLTWHFYAFKIHQAFFYVFRTVGSQQAEKFMSYIFTNQDQFAEEQWMNKTVGQFLDELAFRIAILNRVDRVALRKQLEASGQSYTQIRYHWKYTVGSHGVAGAPIFELNGVRIDGAEDYLAADWINFLNNYKQSKQHVKQNPTKLIKNIFSLLREN